MYNGIDGNDINQVSYKLAKTALKNTPSQNPKEFATTAEREAKANEGKVSSIINLVDEIDTTIFVINDKILNKELRGYNGGFEGGGKRKRDAENINQVPNKFLMKEVRDRGISKSRTKDDLVRDLQPVKDEVIAKYNQSLRTNQGVEEAKQDDAEAKQEDVVSVDASVVSDSEDETSRLSDTVQGDVESVDGSVVSTSSEEEGSRFSEAVQDASNTSDFIQGLLNNNGGDGGYDSSSSSDNDSDDSDDTGSIGNNSFNDEMIQLYRNDINDETGSNSSTNDRIIQINTNPNYGGDDYFTGATNDIGDLVKSNLNSNIMKLEEQINRLSRLTKGINKFINYSSSIETEKLKESNTTLKDSYMYLLENLNDDGNVDLNFDRKIVSILNKLDTQINVIISALNGYSGIFTGGSYQTDFLKGFKKGFDGTIDSGKKMVELGRLLAPLVGAGREANMSYMNSSKKRFY